MFITRWAGMSLTPDEAAPLELNKNSTARVRGASLLEVARRLRNPRIDNIASSYRESLIALRRVIFLTVCVAWML